MVENLSSQIPENNTFDEIKKSPEGSKAELSGLFCFLNTGHFNYLLFSKRQFFLNFPDPFLSIFRIHSFTASLLQIFAIII